MLPSSQDKKNLIESMKKLTHHISNNAVRQKQIFDSLSRGDLLKIISNLSDENQCTLTNIQEEFLDCSLPNYSTAMTMSNLEPLNYCKFIPPKEEYIFYTATNPKIPINFQKYDKYITTECIQLMKSALKQKEQEKFCWTINLDRKVLQIQFLDYKKYSSFTFLDPNRNIFGFTYSTKKKPEQIRRSNQNQRRQLQNENTSKQKSMRSIDSKGSSRKDSSIGSTFYKNYLQFRNKKGESPTSYRDHYQKRDFNKPNSSSNHKNDYMQNSYNKTPTQNISQYTKNKQHSYDKIGTPSKKDYLDYKVNKGSLHDSLDLTSTLRSPVGSAYRQPVSMYREAQTDRKYQLSYRNKISDSDIFNGSTAERPKYPDSTKNSVNNQHQKYYKRVKEILKK